MALISVCMPYFNRQAMLDRSLEAYRRLYDDLEICVCDDGSDEPVSAPGCKVVTLPHKDHALNPCVPINRAIGLATRDVIVLTNPEILHTFPIFDEMAESLRELGPLGYVTAACQAENNQWLAHSSCAEGDAGRGPMPTGGQFHFCAMFTRELWEKTGGFDEDYRDGHCFDDNDWLWRLHKAGAKFLSRDDLVVQHYHTGCKWPAGGWQRNAHLLTVKWANYWQQNGNHHHV